MMRNWMKNLLVTPSWSSHPLDRAGSTEAQAEEAGAMQWRSARRGGLLPPLACFACVRRILRVCFAILGSATTAVFELGYFLCVNL